MRVAGVITLLTSLTVTSAALATDHDYRHSRKYQQADYDYARVVDVEPVVKQVRIETPRRECRETIQSVESRPDTGARTVLGGVIGGVLGSQFGSGRGRDAATVAGALIGSRVGYDSANGRYSTRSEERVIERCNVRYETEYEERIEGYRVTYEYNGREYTTRLPYDPGKRIKVRVAVAPAE
jgi:uncharacterized protein YcfJ